MDTITHSLLGAQLACAAGPANRTLSLRERALLGAVAGAFPDVDFAGFLVDPMVFLADWHQGPTHSLLLMPLWASMLAAAFVAIRRRQDADGVLRGRRWAFGAVAAVCGLAIASHIASDALTDYGTAIVMPVSDWRASLSTSFVIDPLFGGIVALGLARSLRSGRRRGAALGLAALAVYCGAQWGLQQRAIFLGEREARARQFVAARVVAIAQPFSPLNWKLIVEQPDGYRVAHVNLLGFRTAAAEMFGMRHLSDLARAYRAPDAIVWETRRRYGEDEGRRALVRELWNRPDFAAYRRFARYPSVSSIDESDGWTCVWFSDLRYDLPTLPDVFRYGFCREEAEATWQPYRLRYFTSAGRQALR